MVVLLPRAQGKCSRTYVRKGLISTYATVAYWNDLNSITLEPLTNSKHARLDLCVSFNVAYTQGHLKHASIFV